MKLAMSIATAAMVLLAGCQTTGSTVSFQNAPVSTGHISKTDTTSGWFVKPEGAGPFPAVVLLHSCGGPMNHIGGWTDFLASRGYAVLAVESFASRGVGPCPNGISSQTWTSSEMVSDAYGALDYLAAQPGIDAARIYVMGFSIGGWTIRNMATRESASREGRNFRAAISLYDGCGGYGGRLTFPAMVVIGTNDGHDFPSCEYAARNPPSPDLEIHILDGAYHAFDEPRFTRVQRDVGGRPMLYSARAVDRARELVTAYLAKHR